MTNFKKEFKYLMGRNPGEFKMNKENEEEPIIRFDLVRQIFLERGL